MSHDSSAQLAGILSLIEKVPFELFVVPPLEYCVFVVAVETIREQLSKWKDSLNPGSWGLAAHARFGDRNALGFIRHVLSRCPDEWPAMASSELSFIPDSDLRNALRQDLSGVHSTLANGEWKGCTVLGGSLCEALLLWKLQQQPPSNVTNAAMALVPSTLREQ